MIFHERANRIFEVLKCSNAAIAKAGGMDPSLISRFRTGARIPGANSPQLFCFCRGIALYAAQTAQWDKLSETLGLFGDHSREEQLRAFLTDGETAAVKIRKTAAGRPEYLVFGEKLNRVMTLLNISNIRLARALNVDTSLISRFRNGLRLPSQNSSFITDVGIYLYKLAKLNGMDKELFKMLGIGREVTREEVLTRFEHWFSDEYTAQNNIIDRFFNQLDHLSTLKQPYPLPLESFALETLLDAQEEYIGVNGLRRAVIRLLSTVVQTGKPHTLKLYSDQSMDWLSSDAQFVQKWAALMYAVFMNRNTVKIIHNIDRDLTEMLVGIEKWLPLYRTGLIEGYCCKNPSGGRFSHTLFVAPQTAALSACLVPGTEEEASYQYHTAEKSVAYYEKQADALLEASKPLVRGFTKARAAEYRFMLSEMSQAQGNTKKLRLFPSIATMPNLLLKEILIRNQTAPEQTEQILHAHADCVKQFEEDLKNGNVVEYTVFPKMLPENGIFMNLSELFIDKTVFLTPEDCIQHIASILAYMKNNRYDVIPLQDNPFADIHMTVKENRGAVVQMNDPPITAFSFSHPLMCRAIGEYIDRIGQRCSYKSTNKYEQMQYIQSLFAGGKNISEELQG